MELLVECQGEVCNPQIIDTIKAYRYTQRVLLVFLGLLVFLLSLVAVTVQFTHRTRRGKFQVSSRLC